MFDTTATSGNCKAYFQRRISRSTEITYLGWGEVEDGVEGRARVYGYNEATEADDE